MPGYWFMYNMYALARNADKYASRDKRNDKTQEIEYDFLAPDSVNEMFDALQMMKQFTAKAYAKKNKKRLLKKLKIAQVKTGESLLEKKQSRSAKLEILAEGFENSQRKVELIKVPEAYSIFKELIIYYGVTQLIRFIEQHHITTWQKLVKALPGKPVRDEWKNIGGQLMTATSVNTLIRNIRSGKIKSWDEVHAFYNKKSRLYRDEKFRHAFASLLEVLKLTPKRFTRKIFIQLLQQAITTKEWMVKAIYNSRAKDYQNPFRQMLYDTQKEMEKVIGKLTDNSFIKQQREELFQFREKVNEITRQFLNLNKISFIDWSFPTLIHHSPLTPLIPVIFRKRIIGQRKTQLVTKRII